jgi:secreted Zn-dependent insulinase-like peptidase
MSLATRCLLHALFCAGLLFRAGAASAEDPGPVKSPSDPREYAIITLNNGLTALLISDPASEMAAAALDVAVGSSADPATRLGLAHFLEHMLFLGTRQYPRPDEYQEFITRHGGSHNAYTAFENTNYFFDIDKDELEPALDRFSQFFIAPLFAAEYVERERNAVHSEYQSKLKDDLRRGYAVMQQALNPAHPMSRFAVGSLETLDTGSKRDLRADLLAFYRAHYSAGNMRLVVLGTEPLSKLEDWVRAKFSAIAKGEREPHRTGVPLFEPRSLPIRLDVVPEKDTRSLNLLFPLPAVHAHYRAKPAEYLAGLLGHEGPGSVLSILKRRGWADGLSAGLSVDNSDSAALTVNVDLTQGGAAQTDAIIALVFQYLDLVRERGIEQWRQSEQARLYDIAFQFAERTTAIDYVSDLASALQIYPAVDVLRAGFRNDVFDPALLRHYLDQLTPENVLVTVLAPETKADRQERWYKVPYRQQRIAAQTVRAWREAAPEPALALPEANAFIPEELTVLPEVPGADVPVRVDGASGVELWHHQDGSYREPRAAFYVSVRTDVANASARNSVMTDLFVDTVKEELNEYAYPASLAGLQYDVYTHVRGFTIKILGYSDKQALLLDAVLERVTEPTLAEDRFAVARETLLQDLENSRKDSPYAQAMREVNNSLVQPFFTVDERLAALKEVDVEDLRAFVPQLLAEVYPIALAHGNRSRADAVALASRGGARLLHGAAPHAVAPSQIVKLAAGDFFGRVLHVDHPDAALALYYQGPDKRYASRARMDMLGQILATPYYARLRTDQQLGYVVFAGSMPLLDVPGMVFVVQSPVADPGMLETHTQAFLRDMRGELERLDPQTLAQYRQGLITRIMDVEQRLQERSDRYWYELDLGYTRFDSRERLSQAVERVTGTELIQFYDAVLTGPETRRLSVRAPGRQGETAGGAQLDVHPAFTRLEEPTALARLRPRYSAGSFPDPPSHGSSSAGARP